MLKFQDDYTTLTAIFEDFILLVYTIIDDLYQQFVPSSVSQRCNINTAKMSDSEIITLSICSELVGIDSPLPVCKFGRARYCCSFREDGANFGFKVHALITLEGYITVFGITPASVDDKEGLRDPAENRLGLVVFGDKGYTGETLFEDMRAKGICLMSLKPSNYKWYLLFACNKNPSKLETGLESAC